mmetsp:Transcript_82051/g.232321  ORF Transcript_82051/g.232321 Transcript_82051/m.232321 type:complete len:201 (-) Transcript_82051:1684-2286(-)
MVCTSRSPFWTSHSVAHSSYMASSTSSGEYVTHSTPNFSIRSFTLRTKPCSTARPFTSSRSICLLMPVRHMMSFFLAPGRQAAPEVESLLGLWAGAPSDLALRTAGSSVASTALSRGRSPLMGTPPGSAQPSTFSSVLSGLHEICPWLMRSPKRWSTCCASSSAPPGFSRNWSTKVWLLPYLSFDSVPAQRTWDRSSSTQ